MLDVVWISDLMQVFWLMTIVSSWADLWEEVKEWSLCWEWDEWNLFLVAGIAGLLHWGDGDGSELWGRRRMRQKSRSKVTHYEEAVSCQGAHRGPKHHGWGGGAWRVTEFGFVCAMWNISFPRAWPRQCQIPSKLSLSTSRSENQWPTEQLSDL